MKHPRTVLAGLLAGATLAPCAASQIFVPARSAPNQVELNSRLNLPMRANFRSQTVLDATELPGPTTLTSIALRYDGPSYGTAGGTLASFEVFLAPAATSPGASSAQFNLNHVGALTRVVNAINLNFAADQSVDPSAWGGSNGAFALPLSAPFSYAGSGLVVELRGIGNSNSGTGAANCHFDAEVDPATGPVAGSVNYNGQGCQGAALQVSGQIAPGTSISCHGSGLGANALVLNTLGLSRTTWNGLPLPLELSLIGAPGCYVHNDSLIDLRAVADASGNVPAYTPATQWPLPAVRSMAGSRLQFQFWAVSPTLQLRTSNNAETVIGSYTPLFRGYVTHIHHTDASAAVAALSVPATPAMRFN